MNKIVYRLLFALIFLFSTQNFLSAAVIYVNHAATGTNNGSTWTNAYVDLQSAVSTAVNGDEIWVAQGTYYPSSTGNRSDRYHLQSDVSIYGGFNATETNLVDRNWKLNETIISGDLGVQNDDSDNSKILFYVNSTIDVKLDGLIIEEANLDAQNSGGSVARLYGVSPTMKIYNCIVRNNKATLFGCFHMGNSAKLYLENSLFHDNEGIVGVIAAGGTSDSYVTNSTFVNNKVSQYSTASQSYKDGNNCLFASDLSNENSIYWDNQLDRIIQSGYSNSLDYSISQFLTSSSGTNYNTNPNLDSEYKPITGSIAENNGNNAYNSFTYDLERNTRISNTTIDIGAYEGLTFPTNVVLVDDDAIGANDGSSWANAYNDLQDAISAAVAGDEIWVAKGTYYPTTGTSTSARYTINKEISIYGHFNATEQLRSERDLTGVLDLNTNRTVLSGNIGNQSISTDNSRNLIKMTYGFGEVTLDGITITDSYGYNEGGGLQIQANPSDEAIIRNVLFYNNYNTYRGGGIASLNAVTTVENCRFQDNSAPYASSIFSLYNQNFTITNTDFISNTAHTSHSTVYSHSSTAMKIENCSFSENENTGSGANSAWPSCVYGFRQVSPIDIVNCIFWNNGGSTHATEIQDRTNLSISNSIVEGGYAGTNQTNVINQDPLWLDADLNIGVNSPAKDAGDNSLYTSNATTDIDGDDRFFNTTIDMGAQESDEVSTDFIITMEGTSVTIPIYTGLSYNYTVDWGDNTTTTHSSNASHTYSTAVPRQIKISGTFPGFKFSTLSPVESDKLISIDQWGTNPWERMEYAFADCKNLEYNATDAPDLTNVTNLSNMFQYCDMFDGNLNNWDVSTITNMTRMFFVALEFNGNVSSWNVSNVTSMEGMFQAAAKFNGDLKDWDVSNLTNMRQMFSFASDFDSDLSAWDVSNVTNLISTFSFASSFNNGNNNYQGKTMDDWDITNVTSLRSTFQGAAAFNVYIGSWNTTAITDMDGTFREAPAFNQDLSGWDVSSVTLMGRMFQSASNFNQDISGWNMPLVTNTEGMFQSASSFDQNLGNWDIEDITGMHGMFHLAGLSECNYDRTLKGWDAQTNTHMLTLTAGGVKYGVNTFRNSLIAKGWSITDAGAGTVCPVPLRLKSNGSKAQESEVSFFPNPSNNNIKLTGIVGNTIIVLIDINGKEVLRKRIIEGEQIDISQLSTGVYNLQVIDEEANQFNGRLVKQ